MPINAKKISFGSHRIGRIKRIINCTSTTLNGVDYIPNFKGSGRGCVLKTTNDELMKYGIRKRSQIESINGIDCESHGFKTILKTLNENSKSGDKFTVGFMIPERDVKTVEIFFRGAFCPSVEFCAEYDGTNFIIENIPYESEGKTLIDKAQLKPGCRVIKVKSKKVTGKNYNDIRNMILSASNDMRVDYSVMFEDGELSWYNFTEPQYVNHKRKKSKLKKKKGHTRSRSKGSQHKKTMSLDLSQLNLANYDPKRKKKKDLFKLPSDDDFPDITATSDADINLMKTDHTPSPSFGSLHSIMEGKQTSLSKFKLDKNNNNNTTKDNFKSPIGLIQSSVTSNISINKDASVIDNTNNNNLTPSPHKKKEKKGKKTSSPKFSKPINVKVIKPIKAVTPPPPPPIDVDVKCDVCKITFIIKDNELKYHSLNTLQVIQPSNSPVSLFDINENNIPINITSPISIKSPSKENNIINNNNNKNVMLSPRVKKTKITSNISKPNNNDGNDIKYNGLCHECIKINCIIELSKLDGIILAPHLSGHSVIISYIDPNIHKYYKYIIENGNKLNDGVAGAAGAGADDDEKKKDDHKKHKKKDKKHKKKSKKIPDKIRKITENYQILEINGINVENESFEVIFAMYYQDVHKKVKLKLKKYFNKDHLKIVKLYKNHQIELIEAKQKEIREMKAKISSRNKYRNKNDPMTDSDPDISSESDDDDIDVDSPFRSTGSRPSSTRHSKNNNGRSTKRSKSRKKINKSRSSRHLFNSSNNDIYDSDYGANANGNDYTKPPTVQQLIEEHEGMYLWIKTGEKLEMDGELESSAVNYEKGISLLEDYAKELQLSTREKSVFRKYIVKHRIKLQNIKNKLKKYRGFNASKSKYDKFDKSDKKNINDKNDDKKDDNDKNDDDDDNDDDKKKKEKIKKNDPDAAFRARLMSDIITEAPNISFQDVTGLLNVKLALYECIILPQKRPELFTGLRKPTAGLLLFGPPGNGKTMIAKCIATECNATFFSISASSITSKYVGEAERIMRTLFNLAREKQPSIIFIDEIDSLLTARGGKNEAESSRRIKTEFLVQFDGVKASADGKEARVLLVGATNLPDQLDEAVLRRFGKKILVPVPDDDARYGILRNLASKQTNVLREQDFRKLVAKTNLYSASDLTNLCKDASMGPVRDLGKAVWDLDADIQVPPIQLKHFDASLKNIRSSVKPDSLLAYQKWNNLYGSKLTFALSALPQNMLAADLPPLPMQ